MMLYDNEFNDSLHLGHVAPTRTAPKSRPLGRSDGRNVTFE